MCSDQHVKYRMPRGFPLTSSLLLDYHVKQYTHVQYTSIIIRPVRKKQASDLNLNTEWTINWVWHHSNELSQPRSRLSNSSPAQQTNIDILNCYTQPLQHARSNSALPATCY